MEQENSSEGKLHMKWTDLVKTLPDPLKEAAAAIDRRTGPWPEFTGHEVFMSEKEILEHNQAQQTVYWMKVAYNAGVERGVAEMRDKWMDRIIETAQIHVKPWYRRLW